MIDGMVMFWKAAIGIAEAAPPLQLFLAMTVLPLVGVPVSPFWIAAGIRLGPVAAMAASTAALALNVALGYWLASGALRAPLSRWVAKRGYSIPRLRGAPETQFIVMVRVAPPLPLAVQNYVLGLAGVGFGRYMLLSVPVQAAYAFGFVWFGYSLTGSETWQLVLGAGTLVSILLAMNLVRAALRARLRGAGEPLA